jgi:hypothetical protein
MSRNAEYLTLDQLDLPSSLPDYYGAKAELVREIDRRQHALVMGWGGPPQSFAITMNDNGTQAFLLLRVPPYCQWMRYAVIGTGQAAVILTTADDANGTGMGWASQSLETMRWTEGSNEIGTVLDLAGRALKVATAVLPEWSTCRVVLSQLGGTTTTGLRGIVFYPRFDTT